jgi:2-octaprenyl-6-methoxyphenol hydroxylase
MHRQVQRQMQHQVGSVTQTAWHVAVVGAGPVGLALALHAQQVLPAARISLFDARALDGGAPDDGRTLALSQGSVQFLQRLGAWPPGHGAPILEVHVSQTPAALAGAAGEPAVTIRAADLGLPQLGAVLGYGQLVGPLQQAWLAAAAAQPHRLHTRFGTAVAGIKPLPQGVELDAGIAETFDLAVVAEGGVFAEQARKTLVADYGQTAWVGTVTLEGGRTGVAYERFTRHGPAALLPLQSGPDGSRRAALVWCVPCGEDPVRPLSDAQRLAVLNTVFPPEAGRLVGIGVLKDFALGLNAERTLVQGRTVRIGNAAQTLHPVAGQGLNLGLRDAHELVATLRWAQDIDAALRRVEWARVADRWSMIAATDFLARSFTWELPGAATARALGLAALQTLPGLRQWLGRRMVFGGR